jgi:hypothetical protein
VLVKITQAEHIYQGPTKGIKIQLNLFQLELQIIISNLKIILSFFLLMIALSMYVTKKTGMSKYIYLGNKIKAFTHYLNLFQS